MQVVTTDANGNLATDGGKIFDDLTKINRHLNNLDSGVAMALAMTGGFLPDNKSFALAANYGFYNGKSGFATSAFMRMAPNIVASGAIGAGFADDTKVGGRVGVQISW